MPQCLIGGLRSIELVATNLDEATHFYETVWGLTSIERRNDAIYFRGTGGYHHILGLHRGAQPAVVRIVFDVADRQAVDALHKAVTVAGCSATAPGAVALAGGGYGFGCKDPDGRNLAFVCGASDHADAHDQPDRPRKIVHANLNMREHDATLAFFTKTLGFRVVDENAPLTFLHCANADHCSIVLAKTDLPTLNHIAFDVPDFDSVMRGMGRMRTTAIRSNGARAATGRGITCSPISAAPTKCRWNMPPRCCRSTTAMSCAAPTTGNTRQAAPSNGASPRRARRAITGCSGCSDLLPTAIA